MNIYGILSEVKADLGLSGTTRDVVLTRFAEAASRALDGYCRRHFFVKQQTRTITPSGTSITLLDADLLAVTSLVVDSEADGTFDGETWTEGTDYVLSPYNSWPKLKIETLPQGSYSFAEDVRYNLRIAGNWGYGDGESATPWAATSITATVATATGVTLTLSLADILEVTQTILVNTEQMYITALSGTAATVVRGVNGTTAAIQAAKAVSVAKYPPDIARFAAWFTGHEFKQRKAAGMAQERIGDYFYTRLITDIEKSLMRCLTRYVRGDL